MRPKVAKRSPGENTHMYISIRVEPDSSEAVTAVHLPLYVPYASDNMYLVKLARRPGPATAM